jgi:glycosyltransferase involved in cell wall biosynthesis
LKGNKTMTLLSAFGILPAHCGETVAPKELDISDLSIIVPVKNNQAGINRLLEACLEVFPPNYCPAEILLVDNLSYPPLEVSALAFASLPIRLLICSRPGAAAARNLGAQQARTQWLLFLDSDCIPTSGLIEGYQQAMNGAVAYAGVVRAEGHDLFSQYYDTQGILHPLPLWNQGEERSAYLITANSLVWRPALAQIGGLDERFPSAGGEDIDLGLRLWEVGSLAYAPAAQVFHTFEPSFHAFVRRFVRYGRGNRLLSVRYQTDLTPRPFVPRVPTPANRLLATIQFLSLWWGYHTTRPAGSWATPPHFAAWLTTALEDAKVQEGV